MLRPQRPICTRSIAWSLLAATALITGRASADQTYDQSNASHVWDTTTQNWNGSTAAWINNTTNNAIFTNTAQTVDVNGTINVGNITFNSNGWNISDPTTNGSLNLAAPSTISVTNTTDTATISAVIASGAVTVNNGYNSTLSLAGSLVLSGANTYSGDTNVNSGVLKVANNSALGDTTGVTNVATNASLVLANNITVSGETLTIAGNGFNFAGGLQADAGASATWAGALILGTSARVGAQSGGVLTLSGAIQDGASNVLSIAGAPGAATPGVVIVSGAAKTYTGNTQIIRGVLKIGATDVLPTGTVLDVDSSSAAEDSTFDLNGFNQTVAQLTRSGAGSGTGGSFITNSGTGTSTLTVNQTTATSTYSGNIQNGTGTVALTKSGTGTLTLSGTNNYSGATTISAGTVTLTGSLNNTAITVSGTGFFSESAAGSITGTSSLTLNGSAGTFNLAGTNNYSGATTVSTGTLSLSGSLNNTAITVGGTGNLSEGAAGSITGTSSITLNAGTSGLNSTNTFTGTVTVNSGAVLNVNSNAALGSTVGGTTVANGGRVVLNVAGMKVSGETITISGTGGNNNGALQTGSGISAEWAGNIVAALDGTRIGPNGGTNLAVTLTISGVISNTAGVNAILFSRGGGTTLLNAVNTYTADTQLYADATGAATLKIGVDNAINSGSKLSVYNAATPSQPMTLDLNGHVLTLKALDTSANQAAGAVLSVANNLAASTSVLTLTDPTGGDTFSFSGSLKDGTSGTGGLSLAKNGSFTQILVAANTYTGSTTVNAGTLQIGGSVTSAVGSNGTLASTNIIVNPGGIFAVNNVGTSNNNTNRLSDSAVATMKGGTFLFSGSGVAATNSSETIGSFALGSGISTITVTANGNLASLTAGLFSRQANGGIALVNGVGLGKDATSNVGRLFATTAPDLVGTTAAKNTGINAAAKDTKIVPYLLGEATNTSGSVGTLSGTADTFVTYEATTGLRPLNPTDEFTQNSFVSGNNTRLTSATTLSASTAINSLLLDGGAANIATGQVLTVTSGAILFSSNANSAISGGTLDFGAREGIITVNLGAAANPTINSLITGTAGVSYYGTGTLVLAPLQSTYSGNTLLAVAAVIPQGSSTGPDGAPTSGPFGTGTVILGGSTIRATSASTGITIANPISFAADTTVPTSSATDQPLIFTGPVTLTGGTRILTQNSNAATSFSGNIGESTSGSGLTVTGSGSGPVILGGTDTYTGATLVKGGTVVVSGSLAAGSAVTVGDATSLGKSAILGGAGSVGNVTVGAAALNTGAKLAPHAGSAATTTGVTFHAGSVTFADSSTHLTLQIGRSFAFNGSAGNGTAGGDVSDHLATTGTLSLNGADLQLSLLATGYTPALGDLFFLTINSGGAINGTFSSLNGTPTTLSEGSIFSYNSQNYEITYQANYSTNSFSGGNDIALQAVVVPEPGTLVSLVGGLGCLLGAQRLRRPGRSRNRRV